MLNNIAVEAEKLLNSYLKNKKRIKHSISLANFMKDCSPKFGLDQDKAFLVGLVHDIGKELSDSDILSLSTSFKNRGIVEINYWDFKINFPFLLHGVASAEILIDKLDIIESDILKAIINHTTGGTDLDELSKLTFICDFCEPKRKYKEAKMVRDILAESNNLNRAYLATYKYILQDLLDRELKICPESIDGYNEAHISKIY